MSNLDSKREVTGIVLFFCAVALILMYYLPESVTGVFGEFLRSIGFGLIGSAAFLIPVFLLYAAIDFFMEKREGVSPIRVRSVILFVIGVSALLCLWTNDFDYIRSLCLDAEAEKFKATAAVSLLWRSGPDTSLITNPVNSANSLSGGILGGGIAIALYSITGKVISILAVIVFILSQIILVFHISLKKTAKRTAKAVGTAARQAYNSVRQNNYQRKPMPRYRGTGHYVQSDQVYRGQGNSNVNPRSPFVNAPTDILGVPMTDIEYDDPFKRMPVDSKSGFIDVSSREFGANTTPDSSSISYGTRKVSTSEAASAPRADFGFTPMPKNPPLKSHKQVSVPSFLKNEPKQDFYDLSDGTYPGEGRADSVYNNNDHHPYDEQDEPYELIDDDPYNYGNSELREDIERRMAYNGRSSIAARQEKQSAADHNEIDVSEGTDGIEEIPEEEIYSDRDITINAASDDNKGFSLTEGRIIDTTSVREPSVEITSVPSDKSREKKIVSRRKIPFKPAPASLLDDDNSAGENPNNDAELKKKAIDLEEAIQSFGINAKVINITHGPAITRFELTIDKGVKVSRVLSLQDDIALAMAAISVRIEAPIPGKSAIGIEIPNDKTTAVKLRGLLERREFKSGPPLEVPLGKDIPGKPIMCNIAKMPHLLIAGSTGSGKSVCINTILTSILCKATPDQVRMILIDPKVVELSIYNGIPHLLMPVVTDPKKASNALKWAVMEMEKRYKLFAECSVRDFAGYNEYLKYNGEKPLPLVLIVIDELADLMTVAAKEVEDQIARLAAMARAAGLHLLIATQRPSVDVITGVIKANIPSRIAFAVSSGVDSRTILDSVGAEKLLGKGDMLYAPRTAPKPVRGQGAFLSDKEVETVVDHLKTHYGPLYDEEIERLVNNISSGGSNGGSSDIGGGSDEDDLLNQAVDVVIDAGNASVSILQRRLGIGYPRAARLIDVLEQKHIIGPFEGSKPRKVLITKTDWLEMQSKGEN